MPAHPSRPLLCADDRGIACAQGGFWIDPWRPVPLALITHAHADHARPGMGRYIAAEPSLPMLRRRLPKDATIDSVPYGQAFDLNGLTVSFHPAGHCLGAAQIRVESGDEVAVAAGDYKRAHDPTCAPFEVIPCDTFITEATFALPVYRWSPAGQVADEILDWHDGCRAAGKTPVLCAYALGKAQRLLAEYQAALDRRGEPPRPIFIHGALEGMIAGYREQGIKLPPVTRITESMRAKGKDNPFEGALILATPSATGSPWMKRFGPSKNVETAFASGWMRVRGIRRRRAHDRGFVMSDHADWPGLIDTCAATGAKRVLCTHGYAETLARYLSEQGIEAEPLETAYQAESED